MALNWTTILVGAIPAVVNALAIFLATRYAGHVLKRIETKAGLRLEEASGKNIDGNNNTQKIISEGGTIVKANLTVRCHACEAFLGDVLVDTADLPEDVQSKLNKVILAHREDCRYYRTRPARSVEEYPVKVN